MRTIGLLCLALLLLSMVNVETEQVEQRFREIKLIFVRSEASCQIEPDVYEVDGDKRRKLGSLLPVDSNNFDPFVSYYNRDVEVLILRRYLNRNYEISSHETYSLGEDCGKRSVYRLARGR
ncbi:MAG: hypothetical protein RLP15_02725 [Cryomorphaceae bacterium]